MTPPPLPTLVLLHGFAESREIWTDFSRELPDDLSLLTLNLPGHGTHIHDVRDYSLEAQARYVAQKVRAAGLERVVLVGHSMGGYVALAFAERYPERVAGLVLLNSTAYADTDEKRQNREKNIDFIQRHGVPKFMSSFVRPLFAPVNRERLPAARELLEEIGAATPEATFVGALRAMAIRPDRTAVLRDAEFPVLTIAGKDDVAVPFEDTVAQAALPAESHALFLADVGHLAYLEKPAETRRAVVDFAAAVAARENA